MENCVNVRLYNGRLMVEILEPGRAITQPHKIECTEYEARELAMQILEKVNPLATAK